LHPKFYKRIFFWNVKSSSNYSEKVKLAGIHTVTLVVLDVVIADLFYRFHRGVSRYSITGQSICTVCCCMDGIHVAPSLYLGIRKR
jgi:hypothetical protein